METYTEMKKRHQQMFNELPVFYAFSEEQFTLEMKKRGLKPKNTDKIYRLGDSGGYYLRADAELIRNTLNTISTEEQEAIAADTTGEGYIFQMFYHELLNHEYTYTLDVEDTLMALGISEEEISTNAALRNGLNKAINKIFNGSD